LSHLHPYLIRVELALLINAMTKPPDPKPLLLGEELWFVVFYLG